MNRIVLVIVIITSFAINVIAQKNLFKTTKANLKFTSDAPLELITASTTDLKGIINTNDKTFAFKVTMNSFEGFNNAMQKTHFKENYIETDKFPNATFEGKIIEDIDFNSPGTYNVRGKGVFSVHGVSQTRIIKCQLSIKQGIIVLSSDFSVFLDEHNIKIPSVVNQKIAEEILVNFTTTLKPLE